MSSETVSISPLGLKIALAKWYRLVRGLSIVILFGVFVLLEMTVGILRLEPMSVMIIATVFAGYFLVSDLPNYLGRLGKKDRLLFERQGDQIRLCLDQEYVYDLNEVESIHAEPGMWPFSLNRIIVVHGGQRDVLETPLDYTPLFRAINLLGSETTGSSR
ncbi:hypothetical protein CK501_14430 [Halovibrio salipaludis]|uniref:Uncharacterized protein n=1 Tax=Halovibrio salipaludis TaxID=2032626 RepID=A0A2A2EZZ3_9GAMM|nr:hypothetical protein [Halovibrio salipaludis]PAU77883.1 hypothetical protein CK501_14430 [Halovibrio salipaludis]